MLTEKEKHLIDANFHKNIGEEELDFAVFSQLQSTEALHYLMQQHNWDQGVQLMQWVVESPYCAQATALEIFWLAQPESFQQYAWKKKLKSDEDNEVFTLLKTIIDRFNSSLYIVSDFHFDPSLYRSEEFVIPEFLKCETAGEASYVYYEEADVQHWFEADWQRKIAQADSVIELFNMTYFIRSARYIDWVLEHPLCDLGVAVLAFWRRFEQGALYTDQAIKLKMIVQKIEQEAYPEVLAYDPRQDPKVKIPVLKNAWEIPAFMKQKI